MPIELPNMDAIADIEAPVAYTSLNNHRNKISSQRPLRPKPVHSMKAMYCSLSMCSILIALLGISYLLFDPLVKHMVLNRLVLSNHSDFAKIWQNPPITPHLKVYFFNLTNPEEFLSGKEKPNVVEIGPYTYHQKWIKENVQWHGNGTMSYSTRKEFTFRPDLSIGNHRTDNLTILNVPAFSAMHKVRQQSYFTKTGTHTAFQILGTKLWVHKTPEQLIWGYPDSLLEAGQLLDDTIPMTEFGFFTKSNVSNITQLPLYTMYTGENDPYKLSSISLFNGENSLKKWNDDQCDKVQGSDGATFNPYIGQQDTLWFFNDQLCRSMPLVFQKNIVSGNLPGYRFVPKEDVFRNTDNVTYPQNSCFCKGEDLCEMIGDGMFAVPKCQFDAPIVLSWVHFLHAKSEFREKVTGLTPPDPNQHGFWFDIQPITGTTLSAKARIQINLAVRPDDYFYGDGYFNGEDTVVPLLWFEEGIDELGPELLNEISEAVTKPPVYKNYILFTLMGVTICTLGVAAITLIRACLNANNQRRNRRFAMNADIGQDKLRDYLTQPPLAATSGFKKGHAHNPSQGSGKFLLASEDSSRQSSANHSRNSSTGTTPPTFVGVVVNPYTSESHISGGSEKPEEQERLLNNDQRSSMKS